MKGTGGLKGIVPINTPVGGGHKASAMRFIPWTVRLPTWAFVVGASGSLIGTTSLKGPRAEEIKGVLGKAVGSVPGADAQKAGEAALFYRKDLSDVISELEVPALVVLGTEDMMYSIESLKAKWDAAADARQKLGKPRMDAIVEIAVKIAGTGHS